jgi:hypothetical protein
MYRESSFSGVPPLNSMILYHLASYDNKDKDSVTTFAPGQKTTTQNWGKRTI